MKTNLFENVSQVVDSHTTPEYDSIYLINVHLTPRAITFPSHLSTACSTMKCSFSIHFDCFLVTNSVHCCTYVEKNRCRVIETTNYSSSSK